MTEVVSQRTDFGTKTRCGFMQNQSSEAKRAIGRLNRLSEIDKQHV